MGLQPSGHNFRNGVVSAQGVALTPFRAPQGARACDDHDGKQRNAKKQNYAQLIIYNDSASVRSARYNAVCVVLHRQNFQNASSPFQKHSKLFRDGRNFSSRPVHFRLGRKVFCHDPVTLVGEIQRARMARLHYDDHDGKQRNATNNETNTPS